MSFFTDHSTKKILILLGHPDRGQTLCGEMALLYEAAAKKAGHEMRRINVGDLQFDPILHRGYKVIQELEPDLKKVQDAVRWCDHLVLIYPNWWGGMPALLKGLFDRVWLPGFAFNMRKHKDGTRAMGWIKRLKGKTVRIVVLSGSHPRMLGFFFGRYTNEIRRSTLWFAGFKTTVTRLGPADHAPEWLVHHWRRRIIRLGRLGE